MITHYKTGLWQMAAVLLIALAGCDSADIEYGRPKCGDTEQVADEMYLDQSLLTSTTFASPFSNEWRSFSITKNFTDYCPAEDALIEAEIIWKNDCPQDAFFGIELWHDADDAGEVPLMWTDQGQTSLVNGQYSIEFSEDNSSNEFHYTLEISFVNNSNLSTEEFYNTVVLPSIVSIRIRLTYARITP